MYESLVENLRYWGACFPGYTLRTAVKKHTLTADDLRQAADALEELNENIESREETIRKLMAATQPPMCGLWCGASGLRTKVGMVGIVQTVWWTTTLRTAGTAILEKMNFKTTSVPTAERI